MEAFDSQQTLFISSCLLGHRCRWHGKTSSSVKALSLIGGASFIHACPEMLGGLPCPRPPVKRRNGRVYETCADKASRPYVTGADRTEEFMLGAQRTLELCQRHHVTRAILCRYSPSCDRYGFTGKLLAEHGIEVINVF